jgi:hypothetical protein
MERFAPVGTRLSCAASAIWFNPGSPFPYGCTYTPDFGPLAGRCPATCPGRRTPTGRRSRSFLPPTTRVPALCARTTDWGAREYGFRIGTSCIRCLSPNYFSSGFGRAASTRSPTFDPGGDTAGRWRSASSASYCTNVPSRIENSAMGSSHSRTERGIGRSGEPHRREVVQQSRHRGAAISVSYFLKLRSITIGSDHRAAWPSVFWLAR